jgi:glycosyltransferase involved in cell wall biosynthesis
MKNVLIVTYYWPPAGGPGVQRPVKFAKYLPQFGYNPIIYTVKNNTQLGYDESLLNDDRVEFVYSDKIYTPAAKSGKSFVENKTPGSIIKNWIRGNLFIPDSRIHWYFKCRKTLKKIFSIHKIDIVFVTGPPQTTHLIGLWIKKKYPVAVVHDFRDPWTDAFFITDFPRFSLMNSLDKYLEANVLRNADAVTTVSNGIKNLLSQKIDISGKACVIENGYDFDMEREENFYDIIYTGTIAKLQIPFRFLDFLKAHPQRTIKIFGNVHSDFIDYAEKSGLNNQIQISPPVAHSEIVTIQKKAAYLLLLTINQKNSEGILTGKLFEYLATLKPVIGFGPTNGDAARILNECNAGKMISFSADIDEIESFFNSTYNSDEAKIKKYHRRSLTEKLANVLDDTIKAG